MAVPKLENAKAILQRQIQWVELTYECDVALTPKQAEWLIDAKKRLEKMS